MFFTRINTILPSSELCGNPMKSDAFCSLRGSWVETFHMLFGLENEYSEFIIDNNRVLISLFSFLVGVMFIYIVIAIVNESFGTVISAGNRAFWVNRLELVSKTDSISEYFTTKPEFEKLSSMQQEHDPDVAFSEKNYLLRNKYGEVIQGIDSMRLLWDIFMSVWVQHDNFDKLNGEEELLKRFRVFDNVMQDNLVSRRVISLCLVPPWLSIGLVTAGLLWPPQVREFVLCPDLDKITTKQSTNNLIVNKVEKKMKEIFLEIKINGLPNRLQSLEDETKQISVEMYQAKTDFVKEVNALREMLAAIDKKL